MSLDHSGPEKVHSLLLRPIDYAVAFIKLRSIETLLRSVLQTNGFQMEMHYSYLLMLLEPHINLKNEINVL
jgi:hypothetical protein